MTRVETAFFVMALMVLAPLTHAQGIAAGDYRLVVTKVDSAEFPHIKLEFQVLPQRPGAGVWDHQAGLQSVTELVKGQEADAENITDVTVCEVDDVVMAVTVDISGSVAGVQDEIADGVGTLFQTLEEGHPKPDGTRTNDTASVWAYDSGNEWRTPSVEDVDSGASMAYTTGTPQAAEDFRQVGGGGRSPIWRSIDKELARLIAYDPTANGQEEDAKRVLVNFTDGNDNESTGEEAQALLNKARRGGATIVNLGYAQQNSADLAAIAEASGGAYMEGLQGNIVNALQTILDGSRFTYCVEYDSPNTNVVNEPATVTVTGGSAVGSARYPLPFVIPEDSRDIELFMPVTSFAWDALQAGGPMPRVNVNISLRDEYGGEWQPEGPDREFRSYQLELPPEAWRPAEDNDPAGNWGFYIKDYADPDRWADFFKVPTDFVDLNREPGELVVDQVDHYRIDASFILEGFEDGAGKEYPSATRLSVQDRTPPHVFLEIRPQDGGPVLEARLFEQQMDVDPEVFPDGIPSSSIVNAIGHGAKPAHLAWGWRDEEGQRQEGSTDSLAWSQYIPGDDGTPQAIPAIPGASGVLPVENGLYLDVGARAHIRLLARDNFANLDGSYSYDDREAFTQRDGDPEDGPIHARFDLQRREADEQRPEKPFLPLKDHAYLLDNRDEPGLTWWIESPNDPSDRNVGYERLQEVVYPYSDNEVRDQNPGIPAGPIRFLKVYAQDGQGNATALEIPIFVGQVGFTSRTLEMRSQRNRTFE